MRKSVIALLFVSILMGSAFDCHACTSVIVSGKATASGKPLMFKNRDTGELNNRVEYFRGPIYSFIGLVNSPSEGGEVWIGTNNAGFNIMNTASYNIKDDDVPADQMDKEGTLMFRALGVCATVKDFENLLSGISKPLGVEANFGVTDASGGAAYFEINNTSWVKYDVNDIPEGYKVVTNFSESGRKEDYKGYERYLTACSIMEKLSSQREDGVMSLGPHDFFYDMSRSYKHTLMGMDYLNDFYSLQKNYGFTGIVPDQDFIPRKSTASSVVIEGVKPGEDPSHTVMWTILGYPCCSVSVPLLVGDEDIIPSYMKSSESSDNAWMCDLALKIKKNRVFGQNISNGANYLDLKVVMELLHSCLATETMIENSWQAIYSDWINGTIDFDTFKMQYKQFLTEYFDRYLEQFSAFIQ